MYIKLRELMYAHPRAKTSSSDTMLKEIKIQKDVSNLGPKSTVQVLPIPTKRGK